MQGYSWLEEYIPTITVDNAGGMCPFQAEGTLQGLPFYYRERSGWASLAVGSSDNKPPYGGNSLYSSGCEVEEFRTDSWLPTFFNLIESLEKTKPRYFFEVRRLEFADKHDLESFFTTNETDLRCGWGNTPEEAFATLSEPSEYLLAHGFSIDLQERMWSAQKANPEPKEWDEKIYPEKEPDFHVIVPDEWRTDSGEVEIPLSVLIEKKS